MKLNIKNFRLDNDTTFKEFSLQYSFSVVSIQRIIVDSLFGREPNEWFNELSKQNLYLEITSNRTDGLISTMPITLAAFVSPYHRNPIFDFNNEFIIPEGNIQNNSSFVFYKDVKIELKSYNGQLRDRISLSIFYDDTPGVTQRNNE